MNNIKTFISDIQQGIAHLMFPNVCLCCGEEPLMGDRHICTFCLEKRFEDANPGDARSSSGVILPDGVNFQQALWQFDKGGHLQNLMHQLKYERLISVGRQLGAALARRVSRNPAIKSVLKNTDPILVPVPLHYLKFRSRGFNQAFHIARGIAQVLDVPICPVDAVVRKRFTKSQTGFSLEQRIENMENAFQVKTAEAICNKTVVIVDDVFTTGATSFELAGTLKEAGAPSLMIWTIAQA